MVAGLGVGGFVVAHVGDAAVAHGEDFEEEGDSAEEAHFVGSNHVFGEETDENGMRDDDDSTVVWHFLEVPPCVAEAMDKGVVGFAIVHRAFFITRKPQSHVLESPKPSHPFTH